MLILLNKVKNASDSCSCFGFAEFVQKEGGQLVFSLLQFILGDVRVSCDGNVKSKPVCLKQVKVEEVDDLRAILPGPCTQDSRSVD